MVASSYAEYYGGGGSGTGSATAIVGGTIEATVGELKRVVIACNQDVTSAALAFIVETKNKVDVATIADASISGTGASATLTLTAPMTSVERTLNWSLVITTNNETVASGLLFCTYDAQGD